MGDFCLACCLATSLRTDFLNCRLDSGSLGLRLKLSCRPRSFLSRESLEDDLLPSRDDDFLLLLPSRESFEDDLLPSRDSFEEDLLPSRESFLEDLFFLSRDSFEEVRFFLEVEEAFLRVFLEDEDVEEVEVSLLESVPDD